MKTATSGGRWAHELKTHLGLVLVCMVVIPGTLASAKDNGINWRDPSQVRASLEDPHHRQGKFFALRGKRSLTLEAIESLNNEREGRSGPVEHLLRGRKDSFNHLMRGKKSEMDHLLRGRRSEMDHLLRGRRSEMDHLLRGKKSEMDHLLRGRRSEMDHLLRGRRSGVDHLLRGKKSGQLSEEYERLIRSEMQHLLRGKKSSDYLDYEPAMEMELPIISVEYVNK
ncbi:hypothetical protein TCAL_09438 [Tigriopus californicus]|uniref:Corticotropin-releasing factor domain-containing protein n=1 Tax=Tigriopus californicus TaxID=6832 RepID=A0A553PPB4_TIGCA|nr:uncharacterized protein LOC131882408 [Tigriopus californicus]TRY79528.1 hypothetical protein TCAL_09438 [Tigriopus californicus]